MTRGGMLKCLIMYGLKAENGIEIYIFFLENLTLLRKGSSKQKETKNNVVSPIKVSMKASR